MCFCYLKELVTSQLDQSFKPDWSGKNVGYIIYIEKILLDSAIVSKYDIQELLVGSDMFEETNERKKL